MSARHKPDRHGDEAAKNVVFGIGKNRCDGRLSIFLSGLSCSGPSCSQKIQPASDRDGEKVILLVLSGMIGVYYSEPGITPGLGIVALSLSSVATSGRPTEADLRPPASKAPS